MKKESYAVSIGAAKEGLSCKEELKLLSKRFGMTETETIEKVIHEVYISGTGQSQLSGALDKAFCKFVDMEDNCFYNGDGSPLESEFDDNGEEMVF